MAIARYTSRGRIFHGWYIVVTAIISNAVASIGFYSFGPFVNPMVISLSSSRTALSWGLTIHHIINMASGPILGPLADRKHGAMLMMVVGGLLLGGSLILVANITTIWQFYVLFGVLTGVATMAVGPNLITPTLISKWFIRKRGRAIAISATGNNVGGMIFTPFAAFIILHFGWRDAWMLVGLIAIFAIAPIVALFVRRAPEDIGLLPDGDARWEQNGSVPILVSKLATDYDWSLREATRSPALWLIVAACSMSGLGLGGLPAHMLPALTDKGYSIGTAASMVTLFSAIVVAAKPIWGLLGEQIQARYLLVACFTIAAAGMVLLAVVEEGLVIVLFPIIYGIGIAAYMPLINLIWADYFGRGYLGAIRGVFIPITLISQSLSPVLTAYIFDVTGTYSPAFIAFTVCYLISAGAIFLARRPTPPLLIQRQSEEASS